MLKDLPMMEPNPIRVMTIAEPKEVLDQDLSDQNILETAGNRR